MKNIITNTLLVTTTFFLFSCKSQVEEVTTTPPVANPYPKGGISLFPENGLDTPRLHFADGTVVDNQPHLFPGTANIANYPESPWYVAQWKKSETLNPYTMYENAPDAKDPILGNALYAYPTNDNQSHLWIFKNTQNNKLIFELSGQHGWLDTMGGSNIFLSTSLKDNEASTLDKRIDLNFKAKIAKRITNYTAAGSDKDGSVVSQFISGLTVQYIDPISKNITSIFMQINHADSRNPKPLAPGKLEYRGCYVNDYGQTQIVYGNNLANSLGGNGFIGNEDPNGPLTAYSYNINNQICKMVQSNFKCQNGTTFNFPTDANFLANWKVTGFYTGLETQDALPLDPNSFPTVRGADRGAVLLSVQLSELDLVKYPSEIITSCNGTTPPEDTSHITSGSFCNGVYEILWQCGRVSSPGTGWISQGNGCYQKDSNTPCK